jgi:hypothetical protein
MNRLWFFGTNLGPKIQAFLSPNIYSTVSDKKKSVLSGVEHGNRKFKIEHVVTEAMVQSTFVPSFISIEAFFIVS